MTDDPDALGPVLRVSQVLSDHRLGQQGRQGNDLAASAPWTAWRMSPSIEPWQPMRRSVEELLKVVAQGYLAQDAIWPCGRPS